MTRLSTINVLVSRSHVSSNTKLNPNRFMKNKECNALSSNKKNQTSHTLHISQSKNYLVLQNRLCIQCLIFDGAGELGFLALHSTSYLPTSNIVLALLIYLHTIAIYYVLRLEWGL